MSGRTHELRSAPAYFEPVYDGTKSFEVRWNDRGFQAGDTLVLREWDHQLAARAGAQDGGYTGRQITTEVTYVLETTPAHGRQPGFRGNGYVVLSLLNASNVSTALGHFVVGARADLGDDDPLVCEHCDKLVTFVEVGDSLLLLNSVAIAHRCATPGPEAPIAPPTPAAATTTGPGKAPTPAHASRPTPAILGGRQVFPR